MNGADIPPPSGLPSFVQHISRHSTSHPRVLERLCVSLQYNLYHCWGIFCTSTRSLVVLCRDMVPLLDLSHPGIDQAKAVATSVRMTDQGYPSKRHRGRDQPHRKKRSQGQPHATSTPTQTADPIFPQDYNVASLSEPFGWGDYANEAMETDWQHDGSEKLGSIISHTTSYLNADTPSGGITNTLGGYVMVPNRSSGAYSSGSGSHQTSEEALEQGQQAFYSPPAHSPPWTPVAEFAVDTEGMQASSLAHGQQWMLAGLGTQSKTF
jgi:hypothetical protein